MEKKFISVGNGILIPWAILTLAEIIYFFVICTIYWDVFFPYVISRLPFVFSTITFIMVTLTCILTLMLMFQIFPKCQLVVRIFNLIFVFLACISNIVFISHCFSKENEFRNRAFTFILAYPDDPKTKNLKLKLNISTNDQQMSSKINKYIAARTQTPAITIICFFIPWLILHLIILRSLSKKANQIELSDHNYQSQHDTDETLDEFPD